MKLFDEIPYLEGERVVLNKIENSDADNLKEMVDNPKVYRYLPTFLFEKQFDDMHEAICQMYDDLFTSKQSLMLGIRLKGEGELCGLAEFYGYKEKLHAVCVGNRLLERFWGQGIAPETVSLMIDYLYTQTDIETITASSMVENSASAHVLETSGFIRTARNVEEDWGYEHPILADKWFI